MVLGCGLSSTWNRADDGWHKIFKRISFISSEKSGLQPRNTTTGSLRREPRPEQDMRHRIIILGVIYHSSNSTMLLHASSTILSFQSASRLRCLSRINPSNHPSSHHSKLITTRQFSAVENTANDNSLLDPYDILRSLSKKGDDAQISFPTYLSPTKLESFSKCPQAFFFLYILQLSPDPPMTPQLARGIICHKALEDLYDLRPEDRSLTNLENLFRREWNRLRGERRANATITTANVDETKTKHNDEYDTLFRELGEEGRIEGYDLKSEIEWGKGSLELLRNYYSLEDPCTLSPVEREMWVNARFSTSTTTDSDNAIDFVVRGKIDRIDLLPPTTLRPSNNKLQLQIIDYKTGKKPWLKYSHKVNERIAKEQFWKMKVYCKY